MLVAVHMGLVQTQVMSGRQSLASVFQDDVLTPIFSRDADHYGES